MIIIIASDLCKYSNSEDNNSTRMEPALCNYINNLFCVRFFTIHDNDECLGMMSSCKHYVGTS